MYFYSQSKEPGQELSFIDYVDEINLTVKAPMLTAARFMHLLANSRRDKDLGALSDTLYVAIERLDLIQDQLRNDVASRSKPAETAEAG